MPQTLYKFSEVKYNGDITVAGGFPHPKQGVIMKKTIITIIVLAALVGVLALSLTACNPDKNTSNDTILFGKELLALTKQMDTLTQLNNGGADIAVMDSVMAGYYTSSGDFAGKMVVLDNIVLSEEQYGIAAKKGSEAFMGKINEALIALNENGRLAQIGATYGLTSENLISAATVNPFADATDNSWNQIVNDGVVYIGYTEFAPIAYVDTNTDTLIGYDIELAKAVFEFLNALYNTNIRVEFVLIEWSQKENLIANGNIDLIWNGMTITDDLAANMTISVPYLANKQACVVLKDDAEKYNTLAKFLRNSKEAIVAVENGSAAYKILTMEI